MVTRIGTIFAATMVAGVAIPRLPFDPTPRSRAMAYHAPQQAEPNDQRTPAGRVVGGELRIEIDLVEISWSPNGPKGPAIPDAAFAERGKRPQFPGPLVRISAGTPVRVSVRNTLSTPVQLHGLNDRVHGDTAVQGAPAFMAGPALRLAPGEEREVRFTPRSAVTSFYYANVVPDSSQAPPPGPDGGLVGAFVVDPAGTPPPVDERIFVINLGLGFTINGLSWPNTERLQFTTGDVVHWRVINTSNEYHPMHLHGFYFTLQTHGDAQTDTVLAAPRPLEVTEGMRPFSTMRMSWKAERAGNWLFHCHLLVHSQGSPPDSAEMASGGAMMDHSMAGLILGITVAPRVAEATPPPVSSRRLDVWTGTRPRVFGESVGYGFVVQRGTTRPAPDSILVSGSPLVLTRGEPTRIVVHNRLPIPLGVHWHGMELQSYYDGVGNWSGAPGKMRAPIPAGDSVSVYMTPPRAGTFMYHIHGEPGNELQQGLYGPLIVLEKGHTLNAATDRLFVLASRGATANADAAINGHGLAPAERFVAGTTYRLRFMQISTNDVKTVRLLKDGKPVRWRPLARDGATLPDKLRVPAAATLRLDVGQTFDFDWTPTVTGVYVLEVATDALLSGPSMQRVAFGVGAVPATLLRIAATGTSLPLADPTTASLGKLAGAYGGPADLVSLWIQAAGLFMSRTVNDVESQPVYLMPLADGTFAPATTDSGLMKEISPVVPYRLDGSTLSMGNDAAARTFTRVPSLKLSDAALARFVGRYENGIAIELKEGVLSLGFAGSSRFSLTAISPSRFVSDLGLVEFNGKGGKVVSFTLGGSFTPARLPDK